MDGLMAQSPGQGEYLLHLLPAEAVVLILERLGFQDLMALRVTCRAFSGWLTYASRYPKPLDKQSSDTKPHDVMLTIKPGRRIQATIHLPNRGGPSIKSLLWFIARCHSVSSRFRSRLQ